MKILRQGCLKMNDYSHFGRDRLLLVLGLDSGETLQAGRL